MFCWTTLLAACRVQWLSIGCLYANSLLAVAAVLPNGAAAAAMVRRVAESFMLNNLRGQSYLY